MASFLMESFLFSKKFFCYSPSEVTLASYFKAIEIKRQDLQLQRLQRYFRFDRGKIQGIQREIMANLNRVFKSKFDALR